jgi:DNA polymerase (family 10)
MPTPPAGVFHMTNDDLARRLRTHAADLARKGDNMYRVRAFRQAAFAVTGLTAPAETLTRDQWTELPGIGNSLAELLERYTKTGEWDVRSPLPEGRGVGGEGAAA